MSSCRPDSPSLNQEVASNRVLQASDREVAKVIQAQSTRDGAGVSLKRSIGSYELSMLDPFLMLDEFSSDNPNDYIAGFPDHPHRGFETVTYMLHGVMEHRDTLGNRGRLTSGSTQWMTAGRGIIHSEMPKQEKGLMWGFQLWVNLPAKLKMSAPRYQDLGPETIPDVRVGESSVRLVAGTLDGKIGPVKDIITAPIFFDIRVPAGASFRHELPESHNAFVYGVEGEVTVGPQQTPLRRSQLAVLGQGKAAYVSSRTGGRVLLLSANPIGEPVARRGPFVMNTQDEIRKAFEDYHNGTLVTRG